MWVFTFKLLKIKWSEKSVPWLPEPLFNCLKAFVASSYWTEQSIYKTFLLLQKNILDISGLNIFVYVFIFN